MAAPTVTATLDDFNRANGTVDVGAPGSLWAAPSGGGVGATTGSLVVAGNQLGSSLAGFNGRTATSFGPAFDMLLTVAVAPTSYTAVFWSMAGGGTAGFSGYALTVGLGGATAWQIRRYTAGALAATPASATAAALAVGDTIWIHQESGVEQVYCARSATPTTWTLIASATDTTYDRAGQWGFELGDSTCRFDNLAGGNVTSTTPVSATFSGAWDAAQYLVGLSSGTWDATSPASVQPSSPVDAPQRSSATTSTPLEASGATTSTSSGSFEAAGQAQATQSSSWETTQPVQAITSSGWEAGLGVARSSSGAFEALVLLAAAAQGAWEAGGSTSSALSGVFETLSPAAAAIATVWETQLAAILTASSPFEALLRLAATTSGPWEASGSAVTPVLATFTSPWEGGVLLAPAFGATWEAAGRSAIVLSTPFETAAALAALASGIVDAQRATAATTSSAWETARLLVALASLPYDARGHAAATLSFPWEALRGGVWALRVRSTITDRPSVTATRGSRASIVSKIGDRRP